MSLNLNPFNFFRKVPFKKAKQISKKDDNNSEVCITDEKKKKLSLEADSRFPVLETGTILGQQLMPLLQACEHQAGEERGSHH